MNRATVLKKIEGQKLDLQYRKRSGLFVNYKSSCDFNPENGLGHSYGWYQLTRKIDGIQILNTYCYSNQTAKHVRKVASVMEFLGIRYFCLEAPKGLQDLETSKRHLVYELQKELIRLRFARVKNNWRRNKIQKQLNLLGKLGFMVSKREIKKAATVAMTHRESELKRKAFIRKRKKLAAYLENECNFRDYDIVSADRYGNPDDWIAKKIAVHQKVDLKSIEYDVRQALESFHKDGFGSVVFYLEGGAQ